MSGKFDNLTFDELVELTELFTESDENIAYVTCEDCMKIRTVDILPCNKTFDTCYPNFCDFCVSYFPKCCVRKKMYPLIYYQDPKVDEYKIKCIDCENKNPAEILKPVKQN